MAPEEILPFEVCVRRLEPVLNPVEFSPYYEDKNMLDRLVGTEHTAGALLRCIGGVFYAADYTPLAGLSEAGFAERLAAEVAVVVKPAVDGDSGRDVQLFSRTGSATAPLRNAAGETLTADCARRTWGRDFIVQKRFRQSPFLAQFNPASVNTLRIFAYRSLQTDEWDTPAAVLRIGGQGRFVDNAHGGGRFVGVSPEGELGKAAVDFLGHTSPAFNGVDFARQRFTIPRYAEVLQFVRNVSRRYLHHRILAYDIGLNEAGEPRVIEINTSAFGCWVFPFAGYNTFGKYTSEIYEFALTRPEPKYLPLMRVRP